MNRSGPSVLRRTAYLALAMTDMPTQHHHPVGSTELLGLVAELGDVLDIAGRIDRLAPVFNPGDDHD